MRAFYSQGPEIVLGLKDKDELEKTGKLECIIQIWKSPVIVLNIVSQVKKRGFLEEPGFHIEGFPKSKGPRERTRYEVYLSEQRFRELTNPEEDPVIIGGHFISRCAYDRCHIAYFAV